MVKIRGILNTKTLNVLELEQGQSYIKSRLSFFLLRVCGAMFAPMGETCIVVSVNRGMKVLNKGH